MTTLSHVPRRRGFLSALLAALAGALALASCGGGVGTGGTGSFGSGPVSGFGSIFVGGIEFDDSGARVLDDDGNALAESALRLGTLAEVEGGSVAQGPNGPAAAAATVRVARLAVGPVAAVDPGARTIDVLGQSVLVDGSTVFDPGLRGGLAGLHIGDIVSVHALVDAGGHPVATRVEPAAPAEPWRLRGFVAALDTAARRLTVGATSLDYAGASGVPADLAVGSLVQLRVAPAAGGGLQAIAFVAVAAAPADAVRAEAEGIVGAADGSAFRLGSLAVDAGAATIVPGNAAITNGAHAEVEGHLLAGTLVADRVTLLSPQQANQRNYRVAGTLSELDPAAQTFVARGVGVDYSGARFVGGDAASLAPGVSVQVVGPLTADGTLLRAAQVMLR